MELTRYQLDNGMTVLLLPSKTAPVVACNVWVGVGSADETPEEAGLAHVHEHMLFKGTKRREVGQLAREIESSGGYINAFTSFDQTCYYVVMSSRYFESGLDILADAIQFSSFDADELERELEVIQEEIKRSEDSPGRVATLRLFNTAYKTHPYRLPVIGTSQSVASFKRDDVLQFFHKHYVPSNMILVLAGDFDRGDARQKVEHYFGDFKGGDKPVIERPPEPPQTHFRAQIESQDIQESHWRMGFHIPDATHEDIPVLDMLSAIMGVGEASQLYQSIQREQELVNSIYTSSYSPKDAGLLMIAADYQLPEDATIDHHHITTAICDEIFRFREMLVSNSDLQRARTLLESQQIYGKQTVEGLAMKYGYYELTVGDALFEKRYYEALAAVTPDDIRRVARKYLRVDNCSIVLSHPPTAETVTQDTLQRSVQHAFNIVQSDVIDSPLHLDSDNIVRIELPDGPTLIIQEDHSVETFAIRCLALGGLRYETPANNGINALLNDLLVAGTHQRSAVDIARETESMASSISGISGRNSVGLAMNGLSRFFEPCFEIFADCLLNAVVPDEEFERERKLQIQQIISTQDQLAAVNHQQFTDVFFQGHPYQMPILGTIESLQQLTAQTARHLLKDLLNVKGLVVSVVGNVNAHEILRLAERHFIRPDSALPTAPSITAPTTHNTARLVVSDLEKNQAHITAGFPAPVLGSPESYAVDILYAILSGQGGRLFFELRDKQSLAYSVYASPIIGIEASAFTINIGTSPEKIEQALFGMLNEVKKLVETPPTAEELERAKRYLIGNHDIGLQKNSSRAMSFGLDELYGNLHKRTLQYGDHISAVTLNDLMQIVQTYLTLENVVVSIVKPSATQVPTTLLDDILQKL